QRSLALPLDEVQRLTGRPDEVSLFAIAAGSGVDEDSLAAAIEAALPEASVYSTAELMAAMDQRLLYIRELAPTLGSISLVGVARGRLMAGIVAEGLALALVGSLLGFPLGLWMAERLDRILLAFPGIPARLSFFVFDPVRVVLALAVVIATGALAGLLPGRGA